MEAFELHVDHTGERATVRVGGEIDLTSAPQLDDGLQELINGSVTHLTLDLSGVSFMDSTGLRVLLKTSKLLEGTGGKLDLREPSDPVRRLLEVSGLDSHFELS
jgi:anti-sigma B factor antagonist